MTGMVIVWHKNTCLQKNPLFIQAQTQILSQVVNSQQAILLIRQTQQTKGHRSTRRPQVECLKHNAVVEIQSFAWGLFNY